MVGGSLGVLHIKKEVTMRTGHPLTLIMLTTTERLTGQRGLAPQTATHNLFHELQRQDTRSNRVIAHKNILVLLWKDRS
jgi:hypothetical protein